MLNSENFWARVRALIWAFCSISSWLFFLWTVIEVQAGRLSPWDQAAPLAICIFVFAAGGSRRR